MIFAYLILLSTKYFDFKLMANLIYLSLIYLTLKMAVKMILASEIGY